MLVEKIKKTIKSYGLISKNDKVLVCVSGGADSLALLYLLYALKKEFSLKLYVAHLDHMLRKDSSKDREFVRGISCKLGLPLISGKVDLGVHAKGAGSLEEAARNARFGFFFKAAKKLKADKIALGHNLDDQAETVLMRVLRGAGLYGLSAILPKRQVKGHWLIRPLIETRRKEIEAFLKRKKVTPRIDKTNLEEVFFRNKIRHNLLPILEKTYNPNIRKVLCNMAESAVYDYDYLNRAAVLAVGRAAKRISLKKLLSLHPAIRRLALRLLISKIKGDTRRITYKHILELENLIFVRPLNSIVDLPKGISVKKYKNWLIFHKRKEIKNT
ncbi:MAG: tRNA lysidine(34) synthetase TilS [Candidatus Omnitrophica bacterium]|nr:tRNA lysidine(34) synthetase TilS [Candidatus Omnitrophota bacterium]